MGEKIDYVDIVTGEQPGKAPWKFHDSIGKLCPNCTCVFIGPTVDSNFVFCPRCGEKVHDVRVIA